MKYRKLLKHSIFSCAFFVAVSATHFNYDGIEKPFPADYIFQNIAWPINADVFTNDQFHTFTSIQTLHSLQLKNWTWGNGLTDYSQNQRAVSTEKNVTLMEWVHAVSSGIATTALSLIVILLSRTIF